MSFTQGSFNSERQELDYVVVKRSDLHFNIPI